MTITLLMLFIAIVLVNHVALTRFHAQHLLAVPETGLSTGSLCGLLTASTLIIGIGLFDIIDKRLLTIYKLEVLHHFFYILLIALLAHISCWTMSKISPRCGTLTPTLFPLITVNGLTLGLIILLLSPHSFQLLIAYSVGSTALFYAALSCFWHFDEYAEHYDVPTPLKGLGISLITCAILVILITSSLNFK